TPAAPSVFPYTTLFRSGETITTERDLLSRKKFCEVLGGTLLSTLAKPKLLFPGASDARRPAIDVAAIDRARILRAARRYLREARSEEHTSELQSRFDLV